MHETHFLHFLDHQHIDQCSRQNKAQVCGRHVFRILTVLLTLTLAQEVAALPVEIDRNAMARRGFVEFTYTGNQPVAVSYPAGVESEASAAPKSCHLPPAVSSVKPVNSAWIWKSRALLANSARADKLIKDASAAGIERLYFQVDADVASLRPLLEAASAQRLQAFALSGDPAMINDPAAALTIIDQVLAYNEAHEIKFVGIQFDIEPHGLPRFTTDERATLSNYIKLVKQLRQRSMNRLALAFVIPFWFDQKSVDGQNLLTTVLANADELAIMSYRTTLPTILAIATNSLCLSAAQPNKKIHLAVEAAPVPDELHFISSAQQLAPYLNSGGGTTYLSKDPAAGAPYLQTFTVKGATISFFPNKDRALMMMRNAVPFENFGGWFINGFDEPVPGS